MWIPFAYLVDIAQLPSALPERLHPGCGLEVGGASDVLGRATPISSSCCSSAICAAGICLDGSMAIGRGTPCSSSSRRSRRGYERLV